MQTLDSCAGQPTEIIVNTDLSNQLKELEAAITYLKADMKSMEADMKAANRDIEAGQRDLREKVDRLQEQLDVCKFSYPFLCNDMC